VTDPDDSVGVVIEILNGNRPPNNAIPGGGKRMVMPSRGVRYTIVNGVTTYADGELVGASAKQINRVRGRRVAMIFQDPLSALNPVHRIGDQIVTREELDALAAAMTNAGIELPKGVQRFPDGNYLMVQAPDRVLLELFERDDRPP
jgi:hypothetical protein